MRCAAWTAHWQRQATRRGCADRDALGLTDISTIRRDHRVLFVKQSLTFPRVSGHDVHCFEFLGRCDRPVASRACDHRPAEPTVARTTRCALVSLADGPDNQPPVRLPGWQERFRSYWGVSHQTIRAVAEAGKNSMRRPSSVSDWMPCRTCLVSARAKIWYAADEWVIHHLSQISADPASQRTANWVRRY